jgi:hypothetical protein
MIQARSRIRTPSWPPRLKGLVITGLRVADDEIRRIARSAPSMRQFLFEAESLGQLSLARGAFPPKCEVDSVRGPGDEDELAVLADEHGAPIFALTIDLVDRLGVDTNYDAELRLDELLRRTAPELAAAISWDTDASTVRAISHDAGVVERLRAVVAALVLDYPGRSHPDGS